MNKSIEDLKNIISDKSQILSKNGKESIEIRRFPNNIIKIYNKPISWISLQELLMNGDFTLLITEDQQELKLDEKRHGGLRLGSGRKSKKNSEKKKVVSFTLSLDARSTLDESIKFINLGKKKKISKSQFIENLILKYEQDRFFETF